MAESKMKEVAKLLGVELEEEFKIKGDNSDYDTYRLTNKGLLDSDSFICGYCLTSLLTGKLEIEKNILDEVEKRYLENLLRPFKNRVKYVEKIHYQKEYLYICLDKADDCITLPYFKKNTMYVGMEPEKEYTLKELRLFEND